MAKNDVELRTIDYNSFDFDDDSLKVSGYVNETGRLSEILNDNGQEFVEIMQPGVFMNALSSADFVDFYYEHDPEKVLATTQNSSLSLEEDSVGLKMSAQIVNTSWGSDAYQMIKSGVIKGMSFGMIVTQDSWDTSGDLPIRTISQIELFEVSAVRFPAYPDSSIESRNIKTRVEARGLTLVKNTKIPEIKKEVRDMDSVASNNELVKALDANTAAQNAVADAMNSVAYTLSNAFKSTEGRSNKNEKPEEVENRSNDEKRDQDEVEEKSTDNEVDSAAETKSEDEVEEASEEQVDSQAQEAPDVKSEEVEVKASEERAKSIAETDAAAYINFFANRKNI